MSDPQQPSATENQPAAEKPAQPGWLRRARRVILILGALAGACVFLAIVAVGCAGWYTSRPQFCRSCHIMEPYYQSWAESSHRDVSCIECHFAPGFGGKIRGKMLGLVQLVKYVTASAGPRPAAEIPDSSCLRSGCHETRLLSGKVNFHGVPFDHGPHLSDTRRGKQLRCTSCHSQIVQGKHMTVTESTCFLCHFKEGRFNQGLGACTRCHQIPDKKYDLGGGVKFSHELAYERGVDCANCHSDLIRGRGEVPPERCQVCHNREADFARINDHAFIHQTHVADHKVDCLNCHLAIQHSLDREKIVHAASDCAACHPNHHREQVDMLKGVGAKTIPAHSTAMLAVRLDCRTCHRFKSTSATGSVLEKASAEVCVMCHDASISGKLVLYQSQLKSSVGSLEGVVKGIQAALKTAKLKEERTKAIEAELVKVTDDLNFLRVGNGIHNVHYASALTSTIVERLRPLCRELKLEEPPTPPLPKL